MAVYLYLLPNIYSIHHLTLPVLALAQFINSSSLQEGNAIADNTTALQQNLKGTEVAESV